MQVHDAFARKKHQLGQAVARTITRMRNKMQALEQQQAATEKAEATRKQADLLTANLYKCNQGDKEVEVCSPCKHLSAAISIRSPCHF